MKNDRNEIERKLQNAMTAQELIDALSDFEPDAPVLFTCDYGDYHHTAQALEVGAAAQVARGRLVESAYSKSGMALADPDVNESCWYCDSCDLDAPSLGETTKLCRKCGKPMTKVDEDGCTIEAGECDDAPEVIVLSMRELDC